MSPSGLGSGLGSGAAVVRRQLIGMKRTPTPTPALPALMRKREDEDKMEVDVETNAKGKKPVTGKKRPVKAKAAVLDESSDDDFIPDPESPSAKRSRTKIMITDIPTATSARPTRTAPPSSAHATLPSSSAGSSSSGDSRETAGHRSSNLDSEKVKKAWGVKTRDFAPTGRVQELLEANGVNTAGNRYEQHFLSRFDPVVTNPTIRISEAVKRMAEREPRLSAEEKVEARNNAHLVSDGARISGIVEDSLTTHRRRQQRRSRQSSCAILQA